MLLPVVAAIRALRWYTLRHGLGVDPSTGRTILRPHATAWVVYYDPAGGNTGPTTQNGITTYWRNTWAGAKAIARSGDSGDWVLAKGGATLTEQPGDLRVSGGGFGAMNGISAQYPAVWGTYDESDPYNWAKCNVLSVTWAPASTGSSATMIAGILTGQHDVTWQAWTLKAPEATCGTAGFANSGVTRFLLERVVTEHLQLTIGGTVSYVGDMATSSSKSIDCTLRHCGGLFGNDVSSGRYSCLFGSNQQGTRVEYCWYHHGGWSESHTRSTPEWGDGAYANPPGAGPDTYKHNAYFTAWSQDTTVVNSGGSWDASLSKFHGHNTLVDGWIDIRNPIGVIVGDGSSQLLAWPSGQVATIKRHLQIYADDINYTDATTYGWGPSLKSVQAGSEYVGGLLMTVNNPGGAGNRHGWISGRSDNLSCSASWRQSHVIGWAAVAQDNTGSGTTTVTTNHCLTHEAATGTNQNAATAFAARGLSATRTMLTFFDAHGVPYSGATDLAKENSGLTYMARNPQRRWFDLVSRYFRSEVYL